MSLELTSPIFQDADLARQYLEAQRWPNGPVCPHCGVLDVTSLKGEKHRAGLYQCNGCRQQFSVTVGTVFERSKVALNKWLLATFLLSSSKKGMSAHQLHRTLGVTYKTAWFMFHRIREAMTDDAPVPMGGLNKIVEADETYIGRKTKNGKEGRGTEYKMKVVTLVQREGAARSFHVHQVNAAELRKILVTNVRRDSHLMTDKFRGYWTLGHEFRRHDMVDHQAGEYVRGNAHTNTVEGFYSIFKRGMIGVYQHCGEQHLHRYTAEFDFRYSNRKITDTERTQICLKQAEGKRLTYRRVGAGLGA